MTGVSLGLNVSGGLLAQELNPRRIPDTPALQSVLFEVGLVPVHAADVGVTLVRADDVGATLVRADDVGVMLVREHGTGVVLASYEDVES